MYKVLQDKNAILAIGTTLPIIGQTYECSKVIIDANNIRTLEKVSIIPSNIEIINSNIVKIDTVFDGIIFLMLPALPNGKIYFIEIDNVPYIDTILQCKLFDSLYINWTPMQCEIVKKVAKLCDGLFFIKTEESQYFALKQ